MSAIPIAIRPITLDDAPAFRACTDSVMRERVFLAFLEAPPLPEVRDFIRGNLERGDPQLVAATGDAIVGWCDVRRQPLPTYAHVGVLGMGVRADHRGRGLGERLLRATLDAARAAGIEKVELSVHGRNPRARALYEKVGFAHEGTRLRGRKVDDDYDDIHLMGLFLRS